MAALSAFQTKATNKVKSKAPSAREMLPQMKSIRERKSLPRAGTFLKTFTEPDSADGMPSRKATPPTAHAAIFRFILCSSTRYATATSTKLMVEVRAAIARREKKSVAINDPKGNLEKVKGSV